MKTGGEDRGERRLVLQGGCDDRGERRLVLQGGCDGSLHAKIQCIV
jgi:hypothetical protein